MMRGRKRKRLGRARPAVRSIVLALVLVLALNGIAGVGYLAPRQAVRAVERRFGLTESTEVLTRRWVSYRDDEAGISRRHAMVYVTANAQAVGVYTVEPSLFGWHSGASRCTDCTGKASREVHNVSAWLMRGEIEDYAACDGLWVYFYGRIYDACVASLRVELVSHDGAERFTCSLDASAFTERSDGTRDVGAAVLVDASPVAPAWYERAEMTLEALDADGRVLARRVDPI